MRKFVSLVFASVLCAAALAHPAHAQDNRNPRNCQDPWVDSALREVKRSLGRSTEIIGYGDQQECNIRNYGGGSWSSYADLKNKVRAALTSQRAGVCRDPWITQAVTEYHTTAGHSSTRPRGYGEVGECNMYVYSGKGQWSSQAELRYRVLSVLNEYDSQDVRFDSRGNLTSGGNSLSASQLYFNPGPNVVNGPVGNGRPNV